MSSIIKKVAKEHGVSVNVLLIEHYGFPMFKFMWFPCTMVRSHFNLFTDFTAKLVKKADNDESFF